jgi:hypothetical protein
MLFLRLVPSWVKKFGGLSNFFELGVFKNCFSKFIYGFGNLSKRFKNGSQIFRNIFLKLSFEG